jgi:hypothetical protein
MAIRRGALKWVGIGLRKLFLADTRRAFAALGRHRSRNQHRIHPEYRESQSAIILAREMHGYGRTGRWVLEQEKSEQLERFRRQ